MGNDVPREIAYAQARRLLGAYRCPARNGACVYFDGSNRPLVFDGRSDSDRIEGVLRLAWGPDDVLPCLHWDWMTRDEGWFQSVAHNVDSMEIRDSGLELTGTYLKESDSRRVAYRFEISDMPAAVPREARQATLEAWA